MSWNYNHIKNSTINLGLQNLFSFKLNHSRSNALNLKEHWDGIFPHLTYDSWAFRTKRIKYNYWEVLRHFKTLFPNFWYVLLLFVGKPSF